MTLENEDIALLCSPLWNYLKAKLTVYTITTERIPIITKLPWRNSVQSFYPQDIGHVERVDRPYGSFGWYKPEERALYVRGEGWGNLFFRFKVVSGGKSWRLERTGFIGIPGVRDVEDILHSRFKIRREPEEQRQRSSQK